MISVCMYRDEETELMDKFSVEGHAGYAEKGKDIVCASVSALTIATVNALQTRYTIDVVQCDGFISCSIRKPDNGSELITKAFVMGIKSITDQYSEYVNQHLFFM